MKICNINSELEDPLATLQSMLRSQASSLPGHIQAVYVHNIIKLAAAILYKAEKEGDNETMEQVSYTAIHLYQVLLFYSFFF